jgi:hypothetical protein
VPRSTRAPAAPIPSGPHRRLGRGSCAGLAILPALVFASFLLGNHVIAERPLPVLWAQGACPVAAPTTSELPTWTCPSALL